MLDTNTCDIPCTNLSLFSSFRLSFLLFFPSSFSFLDSVTSTLIVQSDMFLSDESAVLSEC